MLQALDDLSDVETGSGLTEARVVFVHQVNVIPSGDGGQVSFFFSSLHRVYKLGLTVGMSVMGEESSKTVVKMNMLHCSIYLFIDYK